MTNAATRLTVTTVAATIAALAACIPSEGPGLRRGDPAPPFTAVSLDDGSPVSLTDYRGETLLVNLWATWCHPCRTETPYLQSIYERYRDQGFRLLGVSVDLSADSAAVVGFVEEFGVTYDIALDPGAVSRRTFLARGIPTSVLIDRDGRVVFSWLGEITDGNPTFVEALEATLGRTRPAP